MTESNPADLETIGDLLKQLVEQSKKEEHPLKDFIEAGNKFKDATTSLQNFLSNFLTDAQRRVLETVKRNNLSQFTGVSTTTLYEVGKLSAQNGGNEDEAGNLAKRLLEMKSENSEDLTALEKFNIKDLFKNGQLQDNVFAKLQDKIKDLKIPAQHEALKILGLDENGLGAVLSSKDSENSIPLYTSHDRKKNPLYGSEPSDTNMRTSHTALKDIVVTNAFLDKAHLDEISILAPKLEKVANAFIKVERAHPELVAEGLLSVQGALLALLSANVLLTGSTLISKAGPATKLAGSVLQAGADVTAATVAKYGSKAVDLTKTAVKASKETAPAALNIAKKAAKPAGSLGLGMLGLEAMEGVGAAGMAEFGLTALLAPEFVLPIVIGAAGAYAMNKWLDSSNETTENSPNAFDLPPQGLSPPDDVIGQQAPEVSHFVTQADQGQEIKIENAQQQGAYFHTMRQKEKQGFGNRPLSLSFGNINVETREDDDPFAFAEAVKGVVSDELMKLIVSFGPYR